MTARTSTAAEIDDAMAVLTARKDEWARLGFPRRLAILADLRRRIGDVAEAWSTASAVAKGIPLGDQRWGSEWLSGPYACLLAAAALHTSLARLWRGSGTVDPDWVSSGPGGRVIVTAVPLGMSEKLIHSGYTGEVWIGPEHRSIPLGQQTAGFYRQDDREGRVCLVLGAGNISSIPVHDALTKLFVEGQVVVLKMSPMLDYLGSVFERMLAPLIEPGYLRIVHGDGGTGATLVAHAGVDTVHVTGSDRTHDAIVYGTGAEGERRRAAGDPAMTKPISSELGGVSPVIVVPGPWSEADLAFQAELVTAMKLVNSGFNCISAQVLVVPDRWQHTDRFLETVDDTISGVPYLPAYYPGAEERCNAAIDGHDDVVLLGGEPPRAHLRNVPAGTAHPVFAEEVFTPVLASTRLAHTDPADFLAAAVHFANHRLSGTLGANLIIHPETAAKLGERLTSAVTDLRYGCVAVNTWTAWGFSQPRLPWGAYPGATPEAIGSGSGFVHNALMFDHPEKSVVTGPFFRAHRSWRGGGLNLAPRPPWFPTSRTGLTTARRLIRHAADGSPRHVPGIASSAFAG